VIALALVFAAVLGRVAPMPADGDARAQQQATACVLYYRLQAGPPPGGSRACEAAGYGADFMRAHWKDIAALESAHRAAFDAKLAHGKEVAAAQAQRAALEPLCFSMILDGGPGPDGGQALCDLAGFTRGWVHRAAHHRAKRAPPPPGGWHLGWGWLSLGVVLAVALGLATRKRR